MTAPTAVSGATTAEQQDDLRCLIDTRLRTVLDLISVGTPLDQVLEELGLLVELMRVGLRR